MSFQLSCGLMKYFSGYTHVVTFRLICWPLPDVHHTIPRCSKQEAGFGVIVYLLCNKNSFSSDILLFIIMFVRLCLLLQWKQFLFFALLGILLETLSLSLLTNEFSDFPFVSIVREENLLPWWWCTAWEQGYGRRLWSRLPNFFYNAIWLSWFINTT